MGLVIMKKTYKNPTLTVVNIQPMNLLQNVSMYGKNAESAAMSRKSRFSEYDDEEYFEE